MATPKWEDTTPTWDETQDAAIPTWDETSDVMSVGEKADEAVRDVSEDMPWYQRAAVGAGRGVTDILQTGRQLFEEIDPGLTDVDAEEYRKLVEAERDTYETGLGDDTAAGIGRFVGQTAPTLAIPAGGFARAGSLARPSLKGMVAQGGATGAVVGGAQEVGEESEDILAGSAWGAGTGAATGGVMKQRGS